jgi:cytoskeletal protein CcmA (bactofilin family)
MEDLPPLDDFDDEITEVEALEDFGDEIPYDNDIESLDDMLDSVEDMNIMKEGIEEMSEEAIFVAPAEAETMKTDLSGKKASDETALITAGMSILGDIISEGSLELEGSVNGNIDILGKLNITGTVDGDSKAAEIFADNAKINGEIRSVGSVKIGQSTVIIGNIFANSAVIAGAVKGDIDVQGPVILDTSAIIMGNIKSKSVQINNGAVIEGMCSQCYADVNPTSFFDELKKGKK